VRLRGSDDATGIRYSCGRAAAGKGPSPARAIYEDAMTVAVLSLLCGVIYLAFTMLIVGDL
jgi:hypothetical protein